MWQAGGPAGADWVMTPAVGRAYSAASRAPSKDLAMPSYDMPDSSRGVVRYERDRDQQGRPANARPRDRFGRPLPKGAPDEMAHAEEPEDVVSTLEEAYARGVELFDAQRFFEAHDFFEHIWKSGWPDPDDKDLWKGVAQVAVGCVHTQRGNDSGALTLLERAAGYLDAYPAVHQGVPAAALAQEARGLAARVREHGASPEQDWPRFPRAATA